MYHMNISNILYNNTLSTTIRPNRNYYVTNPFDSWYVGGILFMCTIMLVLLYANYYRDNYCQECWLRLLRKICFMQPLQSSSTVPTLNRANDPLLI